VILERRPVQETGEGRQEFERKGWEIFLVFLFFWEEEEVCFLMIG